MTDSTRQQFIDVAKQLFAERGFYGTSIAAIAQQMGMTKQGLLHYFGSKEKLYAEVLQEVSARILAKVEEVAAGDKSPALQLEELIVSQYLSESRDHDSARLIMRELLDNAPRAATAGSWYLKPYLERLVDLALAVDSLPDLDRPRALALIYQLLGAANYFTVSQPTLGMIFGTDLLESAGCVYEEELRKLIRSRLKN